MWDQNKDILNNPGEKGGNMMKSLSRSKNNFLKKKEKENEKKKGDWKTKGEKERERFSNIWMSWMIKS